jgi:GDP-L-fucose synthase
MKKILITGGSGLVGNAFKNTANDFAEQYEFIFLSSSDCNLEKFDETMECFTKIKPHYIIHLAACVGGLYKNMNYKVNMLEKNLLINFNVIKCSYEVNVEKLVCMLSTCIFPDKTTYPIDETMLHNGPPHTSNDAYSYAKRVLEIHCRAYNEQYNTNFCCIIPTNIYGPHDNYSIQDGHVIPALIHKCFLAKQKKVPFEVLGTGTPLRQFIYSDDLARCIILTIDKINKENLIISTSEEYSIKDIATIIANEFEYTEHMVFNKNYSDGQYKKTADNRKLLSFLGGELKYKFMDIRKGIHRAVDFLKKNYDTCRK